MKARIANTVEYQAQYRVAAVDVGSNAIRLVTLSVSGAGAELGHSYRRYPVSLGRDVFRLGRVSRTTGRTLVTVFDDIAAEIAVRAPDGYRAVATAALREADNAAQVVRRIQRSSGVNLEVITGVEESRLSRAALLEPVATCPKGAVLLDLGGGSLELSRADSARDVSLAIGTRRLVEEEPALLGPLSPHQLEGISGAVTDWLHSHIGAVLPGTRVLVGTGGNLDALARLIPSRGALIPSIETSRLGWLSRRVAPLSVPERARRCGIRIDRAELILANIIILHGLVAVLGARGLVVPGTGVRRSLLKQQLSSAGVESAAKAMLRGLGRPIRAAGRVAVLAGALFDGLRPLHGLWEPARDTLQAAAWFRGAIDGSSQPLGQVRDLLEEAEQVLANPHARRVASCVLARSVGRRAPLGGDVADSDRLAARRLTALLQLAVLLDDCGVRGLGGVELLRRPVTIRTKPSPSVPAAPLLRLGRALGSRIVVC